MRASAALQVICCRSTSHVWHGAWGLAADCDVRFVPVCSRLIRIKFLRKLCSGAGVAAAGLLALQPVDGALANSTQTLPEAFLPVRYAQQKRCSAKQLAYHKRCRFECADRCRSTASSCSALCIIVIHLHVEHS